MICPHCQKQIPSDSLVCGYCGHKIEQALLTEQPSAAMPEERETIVESEIDPGLSGGDTVTHTAAQARQTDTASDSVPAAEAERQTTVELAAEKTDFEAALTESAAENAAGHNTFSDSSAKPASPANSSQESPVQEPMASETAVKPSASLPTDSTGPSPASVQQETLCSVSTSANTETIGSVVSASQPTASSDPAFSSGQTESAAHDFSSDHSEPVDSASVFSGTKTAGSLSASKRKEAFESSSSPSQSSSEDQPFSKAISETEPLSEKKPVSPEKKLEEAYIRRMAKRQRPLKTASFFWTEFLLLIPGINLVLLFVWAFRKNANANRKAFARSILIWILLFIVFLLIVLVVMIVLGVPIDKYIWLQSFQDWAAGLRV